MKYLLILLLFHYSLFSQINCDNCKNKEYPFIGCENGKKTIACSSDPNNEQGFRPWKKCLNQVLFYYDASTYPLKDEKGPLNFAFWPSGAPKAYTVFDINHVRRIITEAFDDWIKPSCYPNFNNDKCQPCELRVKWAQTQRDMLGNPDSPATTLQEPQKPITGGDCIMDCSTVEIRLNGTPEWTGIDPNNVKGTIGNAKNFFRTAHPEITTNRCYDFRSVLRHEIGHWLGFADMIGVRLLPCSNSNSIMNASNFDYDMNIDITNDDKCMFYVLYCCPTNTTSVDPEEQEELYIYPQPASETITIPLSLTIGSTTAIEIYDMLGNKVSSQNIDTNNRTITINVSHLPSGKYRIYQIGNNGTSSSPMIKHP